MMNEEKTTKEATFAKMREGLAMIARDEYTKCKNEYSADIRDEMGTFVFIYSRMEAAFNIAIGKVCSVNGGNPPWLPFVFDKMSMDKRLKFFRQMCTVAEKRKGKLPFPYSDIIQGIKQCQKKRNEYFHRTMEVDGDGMIVMEYTSNKGVGDFKQAPLNIDELQEINQQMILIFIILMDGVKDIDKS